MSYSAEGVMSIPIDSEQPNGIIKRNTSVLSVGPVGTFPYMTPAIDSQSHFTEHFDVSSDEFDRLSVNSSRSKSTPSRIPTRRSATPPSSSRLDEGEDIKPLNDNTKIKSTRTPQRTLTLSSVLKYSSSKRCQGVSRSRSVGFASPVQRILSEGDCENKAILQDLESNSPKRRLSTIQKLSRTLTGKLNPQPEIPGESSMFAEIGTGSPTGMTTEDIERSDFFWNPTDNPEAYKTLDDIPLDTSDQSTHSRSEIGDCDPVSNTKSGKLSEKIINASVRGYSSLQEQVRRLSHGTSIKEFDYESTATHYRNVGAAKKVIKQKFVVMLCRALMLYGAPTHRLEDYMNKMCKFLELESQFLFLPGCMVISFGDSLAHASDMQIVRVNTFVDVTKFEEVYRIYKDVVHDRVDVDKASEKIDGIIRRPSTFPKWLLVCIYGLATTLVAPFAFGAGLPDMPFSGLFGMLLGYIQLYIVPQSELYANIYDVGFTIASSFIARALGSIYEGNLFCFSALAQSSIALMLPGWAIVVGALELQSKNVIAGSIRIFYALIYSLFLGFGVSIGTALYGAIDRNATSASNCPAGFLDGGDALSMVITYAMVFIFTICLNFLNQSTKKKDIFAMTTIAMVGYLSQDKISQFVGNNPQVANFAGAFAVGVLGNLYSRLFGGMAFTTILPGILLQVPSGLSSRGSIIAGIQIADDINTNYVKPVEKQFDTTAYLMAISMVQIAIGITVGLFMAAVFVYPYGKRRTLLFSF